MRMSSRLFDLFVKYPYEDCFFPELYESLPSENTYNVGSFEMELEPWLGYDLL